MSREHTRFLELLHAMEAASRSGRGLVKQVSARWNSAAPALTEAQRELGETALAQVTAELGDATLPCGISHGDFAPWNTRLERNELKVFDWERAEWAVPIDWDSYHFKLQTQSLLSNSRIQPPAPVLPTHERASFLLWLLSWICGLIEESPHDHGGKRRRLAVLAAAVSA